MIKDNKNRALILGVTGQDGCYLSKYLHNKGYEVVGTSRGSKSQKPLSNNKNYYLKDVKIIDLDPIKYKQVYEIINQFRPTEIYNLSGQSSVNISFHEPINTLRSIVEATSNILESIRNINKNIKFYNAGSSECFGNMAKSPANENTPHSPTSPYAVAKSCSSNLVSCYRNAYDLHCCTGILFNHESPLRPSVFVTQKIVSTAYQISMGAKKHLELGRIDIIRDWGWAQDYVKAMYLMLQKENPEDFVIGTGKSVSLKYFVSKAFDYFGLDWKKHVIINQKLFRPNDIMVSKSDPTRAMNILGWSANLDVDQIIKEMCKNIEKKSYQNMNQT